MIHYHGTPINKSSLAMRVLRSKHAFVSFVSPDQLDIVMGVCQSFALDNGAYSFWRKKTMVDWNNYYKWVESLKQSPGCDFAIIPDIIDGSELDNDRLIEEWPFGIFGVPVWHMHESIERFKQLADNWPRIAIGSSGTYSRPNSPEWWGRMSELLNTVCTDDGIPPVKLHGLRMMNPAIYTRVPFASVDSTHVARDIAFDKGWTGSFVPVNKEAKAMVIIDRIESYNGALRWEKKEIARKGFFF